MLTDAQRLEILQSALLDIMALNPATDSDEGYNEWGEAHCFHLAQQRAIKAINESLTVSPTPAIIPT